MSSGTNRAAMADISATVVTLNEEENIRDCLETLTWCNEIIVVDSYSDDDTVEIAREYTNKIFTYERTGYGEPARKKAFEEASGEWICMIDADERIPHRLAQRLKTIIKKDAADIVYAPRKNYIFGQWINHAGWWPDHRPVLYKKSAATLSDKIHDFVSFPEHSREIRINEEKKSIIHFNYTDVNSFISRMNRYTEIEAHQTQFSLYKLLIWPSYEFFYRFILKGGFLIGYKGLFLSIFMSWYRMLTLAKAWQYQYIGDEEDIKSYYDSKDEQI